MISITKEHPLLFEGAIDSEIQYLKEALENREETVINGFPFFRGTIGQTPVVVMKTFMGMVNASAATITAIEHFHPAALVNQGICGGHDPELRRGDFLLSVDTINHTAVKLGDDTDGVLLSGAMDNGIEKIGAYGYTHPEEMHMTFPCDPELICKAEQTYAVFSRGKADDPDFPKLFHGRMGSCDIWIDRLDVMEAVRRRFHTSGEDMETFAAAEICASFNVPFLSVRTPSNSLPRGEEFVEEVSEPLQKMLVELARSFAE